MKGFVFLFFGLRAVFISIVDDSKVGSCGDPQLDLCSQNMLIPRGTCIIVSRRLQESKKPMLGRLMSDSYRAHDIRNLGMQSFQCEWGSFSR